MKETHSSNPHIPVGKREHWSSKLGVVLAVAGSAVGLGNFLRFPGVAAANGGGAFMIPYFISFILLGIPLCWVEWSLGRYGGRFSHGSAPGIFQRIWKNPLAKYLGAIGIMGPMVIFFYYVYIESWTLGYAFYSLTGKLTALEGPEKFEAFFTSYVGLGDASLVPALIFFAITFVINFAVIFFGVRKGIERVSKIAMPVLAILGIILAVRVLTLGTPNPALPDQNVSNGLGFLWNPNFSQLTDPKVWLQAAGQIFFTMSVGIGVILTYATYLRKKDDVLLSGLSASATNGFMEVIIGGSVCIIAACVFFGNVRATEISQGSVFALGFVTMPIIFTKMAFSGFFCLIWFLLLFIAGVTSSISILQPGMAFLQDEFGIKRRNATIVLAVFCLFMSLFAVFGFSVGIVDDLDFWGANIFLILFALIEAIMFGWIFGMKNAWKELHYGADIKIPVVFKYIIQYVTPAYIIVILVWFMKNNFKDFILMKQYGDNWIYVLFLRLTLLTIFVGLCFMIHVAWKLRHREEGRNGK